MTWEVYKHTSPSGRCYVGITSYGFLRRWKRHVQCAMRGSDARGCDTKFYRAIRKYGAETFQAEVLQVCDTEREAKTAECAWIAKLNSKCGGYNETLGGDGTCGHKMPAAAVEKMRKAMLGRFVSDETRARMSATRQFVSAETRAKLSATSKGRIPSAETREKLRAAWLLRTPDQHARHAESQRARRERERGEHGTK